ncbi:S-adenosylmethionine:tRNA ribosyltransferase-isomerase [Soonwooa sp.]|uniref:S-adenosylmethionine:tRNA ribosyltransferase-isomerase n=1 Tax=Soonwooa sp. TaxID=1938592 RepID=UPI00261C126E|nr:S-adenosylmethionine:tRNA ribosyltransferase-isomerase [Soonwooa sp.]
MHPRELKIENFTYDLPNENIAYNPANPRDSSKLLVYKNHEISTDIYQHISEYLPSDAVLVFNDTKVIKSRLFFQNETGATIEVFCLEPYGENINYEDYFQKQGSVLWTCLIGKVAKWRTPKLSKVLEIDNQKVELTAEIIEKLPDSYVVKLAWSPEEIPFADVVNAAGVTPLPPYIKRLADKTDEETYQTVYSEHDGSVAAPTAGLHFTNRILDDLHNKGIKTLFTTLHVGAGTFKPVKSETMDEHIMHSECMNITVDFLEHLLENISRPIIPVGTTSMRTVESIFWMGNKVANNPNISFESLKVTQWEPYETATIHSAEEAISALITWIKKHEQSHISVETEIIIAPSYSFRIAKGLITNFHQPQSTLLLLVSALIGEKWQELYDYALKNDFRFLSYGDGSLLLP